MDGVIGGFVAVWVSVSLMIFLFGVENIDFNSNKTTKWWFRWIFFWPILLPILIIWGILEGIWWLLTPPYFDKD